MLRCLHGALVAFQFRARFVWGLGLLLKAGGVGLPDHVNVREVWDERIGMESLFRKGGIGCGLWMHELAGP